MTRSFTITDDVDPGRGGGGGGGASNAATPEAKPTPSKSKDPEKPAKPEKVNAPATSTPPAWAWGKLKTKEVAVDPGPTPGQVEIKAKGGRPIELLNVSAPPGLQVKVVSKGSDFTKPSTWQKMGYGDVCWKMIRFSGETEYALPSATPPFGAPPVNWQFGLAVVNTSGGQTKFSDPLPGMTVSGGGLPIKSVLLCSSAKDDEVGAVQGPKVGQIVQTRAKPMGPVNGRKITLCHRTSSESNPYVEITVDKDSIVKEGHDIHDGPIFPNANWGDIIPSFDGYAGKNWNADGQKILADGCRPPSTKVSLCHRTASDTNPYVFITVDQSAVLKEGHGSHTGPVFPDDNWGDIIPPFPGYAGMNWTSAGQSIYDLGCDPPAKLKLKRVKTDGKITLCHRTSSVTNPYVEITVDQSAVLKAGHGDHTGGIYPEDNWGDIIPPFGDYPGLNWSGGKSIFDAGCQAPKAEILKKVKSVDNGKITLCHRTSSVTNPYVEITVDTASVLTEGHGSHLGPVFPDDNWGDIIPPFDGYAGLNWDAAGQQIVKDGCKAPKKQVTPAKPVHQKITLCHATSSKANPYVVITVDDDAVLRQGHDTHSGPLFPQLGWGDIIPAFGDYPGLNWNSAGRSILDANCTVPAAPPLEPKGGPIPVPPETPDPEDPPIIIDVTPEPSPSPTPSSSATPTPSGSSGSSTPSQEPSGSGSASPEATPSGSASPTPSASPSATPSDSASASPTSSTSESPAPTESGSPSPSSSTTATTPGGSEPSGPGAPEASPSPSPSSSLDNRLGFITFEVTDGVNTVTIVRSVSSVLNKAGAAPSTSKTGTPNAAAARGGASNSGGSQPALVDTGLDSAWTFTGAAVLILLGLMLLPPIMRRRS